MVNKKIKRKSLHINEAGLLRLEDGLKEEVKESERGRVKIEDGRIYLLVFGTNRARIEGNYAMSGLGWRLGIRIGNQNVSIVRGYQVKELERLKIPYRIFTTKPDGNKNMEQLRD